MFARAQLEEARAAYQFALACDPRFPARARPADADVGGVKKPEATHVAVHDGRRETGTELARLSNKALR